jgi:hypothetical protein
VLGWADAAGETAPNASAVIMARTIARFMDPPFRSREG